MTDTMPGNGPDHTPDALRARTLEALDAAWVDLGYTAPNTEVYPWLWLWDSCFHAIVWAALDRPERALAELTSVLSLRDGAGFVPHMGYQLDPHRHAELWGRPGSSSITQPPMYGHALAEIRRRGVPVPDELWDAASSGLRFLLRDRARTAHGLVQVVHPWETGCDDSPRWDDLCPGDGFALDRWRHFKNDLLASIVRGPLGEPLRNPAFAVGSVGFNALVAWNARELTDVTGDNELAADAAELVEAIEQRWSAADATWVDDGPTEHGSGRTRTADALLPMLVARDASARAVVVESLLDNDAHGAAYGPRGVHRGDPSYDPRSYWRGPVWPQVAYLLWVATTRSSSTSTESSVGETIRRATVAGAARSGLAEYWDPDTGAGGGAIPQSWTGLAVVMAGA